MRRRALLLSAVLAALLLPRSAQPSPASHVTWLLRVTVAGTGTVTGAGKACATSCVYQVNTHGVALTAWPGPKYSFREWGGACSGTESCIVNKAGSAGKYEVSASFTYGNQPPTPPPKPPPTGCTRVGTEGPDVISGSPGDDVICGLGGNDTIRGGGGNDVINGGEGNDRLSGDGLSDNDVPRSNDTLFGGPGNDSLFGNRGNDALDGGPGEDTLDGGEDIGLYQGQYEVGTDRDTVTYEGRTADLRVKFDGLANDGEQGERDKVAYNVERVVGGSGDDHIIGWNRTGTTANPWDPGILGMNNYFEGRDGDDTLEGGIGRNAVYGGNGDDTLIGGDVGVGGWESLFGGFGDDVLRGHGGADNLYGEEGADRLYGGDGPDIMAGGRGNDRLEGGPDADRLWGDANDDVLKGQGGSDTLNGDGGNAAESGNDTLEGGDGNDILVGGPRSDLLEGGLGRDFFEARDSFSDTLRGGLGCDLAWLDEALDERHSLHLVANRAGLYTSDCPP